MLKYATWDSSCCGSWWWGQRGTFAYICESLEYSQYSGLQSLCLADSAQMDMQRFFVVCFSLSFCWNINTRCNLHVHMDTQDVLERPVLFLVCAWYGGSKIYWCCRHHSLAWLDRTWAVLKPVEAKYEAETKEKGKNVYYMRMRWVPKAGWCCLMLLSAEVIICEVKRRGRLVVICILEEVWSSQSKWESQPEWEFKHKWSHKD